MGRRAGGQEGRREGGKEGRREGGQEGRREGGKEGRRAGGQAVSGRMGPISHLPSICWGAPHYYRWSVGCLTERIFLIRIPGELGVRDPFAVVITFRPLVAFDRVLLPVELLVAPLRSKNGKQSEQSK